MNFIFLIIYLISLKLKQTKS